MKRRQGVPLGALPLLVAWVACGAATLRAQCTGCANPSFGPGFPRSGNAGTFLQFAISDFDHDGFLDVAGRSGKLGGSVEVLRGNGRGGFFPPELFPIPSGDVPDALTPADVNADGFDDLVGSKFFSNDVQVFLADGFGGFGAPIHSPAGLSARQLHAADLDDDGDIDIAAASGGVLSVLRADGQGGFAAPLLIPVPAGASDVAVGDFNEDGKLDLAAAGSAVSVFLGDGLGAFVPGPVSPLADPARVVLSARLDPDAHLDLVLSLGGFIVTPSITVMKGNGLGGFTTSQDIDEGVQSPPLALGDIDGDGKKDLLVGGYLKVYPGNGDGTFGVPIETGVAAGTLNTADMTADGVDDVVVLNFGAYVVPGRQSEGLDLPPLSSCGGGGTAQFAAAMLDGDTVLDLAVPQGPDGTVAILLGAGSGSFGPPTLYPAGPHARWVVPAQLDDDATIDLAVLHDDGVSVLLGAGDGTFGSPTVFPAGGFPVEAAAGDFNGDDETDLVVVGSQLVVLLGDGAGGFGDPVILAERIDISAGVGLVNADAFQDLVVSTGVSAQDLMVYLGNGDGTFDDPTTFADEGTANPVLLADFDGDGHLDVPVSNPEGVAIAFGDGNGSFGPPVTVIPGVDTDGRYALGDFTQDGELDLAMPSFAGAAVAPGDGTGAFGPPSAWVAGSSSEAVVPGDYDGDGRLDIAILSIPNIATLLNTNCDVRRIGLGTQPGSCASPFQTFAPQPVVGVYDDGGNVITCDTGVVTASIVPGTGAPGALLAGDTDVAAVSGVATFTDLSIANAASGYILEFSHPVAGITRSRSLTVGDPPPPPAASSSGAFCQGQTLNLFATTVPGAFYRWTGPNGFTSTVQSPTIPNATLDAAGVYSVIAVVDGCESSGATTVVDAVPPAPGPTVIGQTQACLGGALTLRVGDTAFTHQWYLDGVPIPGATGAVYKVDITTFNDEGNYRVTSSDATGCTTAASSDFPVTIEFCEAQAVALSVDPGGNGVLEPGESALLNPTWRNLDSVDLTLLGLADSLAGPAGADYVIENGSADYGLIAPSAEIDCLSASGDCYQVLILPSGPRPATHWDAFFDEVPGADPGHTWILHVGESFGDVPTSFPFYSMIETVLHNGITAGCTPANYCPANGVTRAQMAVFLLKAKYGASYVPPTPSTQVFADVPLSNPFAPWITQLAAQSITAGCGNGNYCPSAVVNRAQMAVFLFKTLQAGSPLPCTGVFQDVPCPAGFAVDYIEAIYQSGVTGGCNALPLLYCPTNPNTRGQMAVFLTKAFGLSLYGP